MSPAFCLSGHILLDTPPVTVLIPSTMNSDLFTYLAVIIAITLVGGFLPFVRRWSDELLHLFVSFGAGIFIGTVFLHLLPEAFSGEHLHIAPPFVLTGYLCIFFVERILFAHGESGYEHNHRVISLTAFLGLSVHSIFEGMGLGVAIHYENLASLIFISILAHKLTAAFSLSSLFILARTSVKRGLGMVFVFSLMTPLGAVISGSIPDTGSDSLLSILLGLTAGTFLYVSVGDLLPEVFHTRERRWIKLALLFAGIIIMSYLGKGHAH